MKRRAFLGLLGGAAAVAILPELTSKTFFLPPAGGWRQTDLTAASIAWANAYLTSNDAWYLKTESSDMLRFHRQPDSALLELTAHIKREWASI